MESQNYQALERAIGAVAPDAIVAPFLVVVVADARHYARLTSDIYRFLPLRLNAGDLARMHGTDERVAIDDYERAVRLYHRLIIEAAGPAK